MHGHLNVKIHIFICLHFPVLVDMCVCVCVCAHTPVRTVRSVPVYSSHLYVCIYGTYVRICLSMYYVWYISYSSVTV